MKRKQLRLKDLQISSFITQEAKIKGGDTVLTDYTCPDTEPNCGGGGQTGGQLTCEKGYQ